MRRLNVHIPYTEQLPTIQLKLTALLLLTLLWCMSPIYAETHILFVSIPWRGHVAPLLSMGQTLVDKKARVSFALPEECMEWPGIQQEGFELCSLASMSHIQRTPENYSPSISSQVPYNRRIGFDSLIDTLTSYQVEMYDSLLDTIIKIKPTLIIIDQYTFAAIDIAIKYNISYMINNPNLLLDLDNPSTQVPASFSEVGWGYNEGNLPISIIGRSINIYNRWASRLDALSSIRNMKVKKCQRCEGNDDNDDNDNIIIKSKELLSYIGLLPFHNKNNIIILTNTIFGIEYPRPLSSKYILTGPLDSSNYSLSSAEQDILSFTIQYDIVIYVNLGHDDSHVLNKTYMNILLNGLLNSFDDMYANNEINPYQNPTACEHLSTPGSANDSVICYHDGYPMLYKWDHIKFTWVLYSMASVDIDLYLNRMYEMDNNDQNNHNNNFDFLSFKQTSRPKHCIVWSLPTQYRHLLPSTVPENLLIVPFAPQQQVLSLSNTKLFVSHGSLTSAQEALRVRVPLLLLPNFLDQWEVSQRMRSIGVAVVLSKEQLSIRSIQESIRLLLNDPSVQLNLGAISVSINSTCGVSNGASIIALCSILGSSFLNDNNNNHNDILSYNNYNFIDICIIYGIIFGFFAVLSNHCWPTQNNNSNSNNSLIKTT